jgi:hypothetical protein
MSILAFLGMLTIIRYKTVKSINQGHPLALYAHKIWRLQRHVVAIGKIKYVAPELEFIIYLTTCHENKILRVIEEVS